MHDEATASINQLLDDCGKVPRIRTKTDGNTRKRWLDDTMASRAFHQAATDKSNRRGAVKGRQLSERVKEKNLNIVDRVLSGLTPFDVAVLSLYQDSFHLSETLRMPRSEKQ